MNTLQPEQLGPISTNLPESPRDEALTPIQWEVLRSIISTVIPALSRESSVVGNKKVIGGTVSDKRYNEAVANLRKKTVVSLSDKQMEAYLLETPYDNPVGP